MSPFLSEADLAATDLGHQFRTSTTVADAVDAYAASLIDDYREARADGRFDRMSEIRDRALAIDPDLVAELDGFDLYPAAA